MNSTNRFLNRLFIFVTGLVLLAAGGVLAVGALLPSLQQPISTGANDAQGRVSDTFGANTWILWVTAGAAVVVILLLLWFIFRQGRGRTSALVKLDQRGANGSLTLDAKVAAQVLEEALSRQPDIVSVDVVAFRIRRENVLRVTAHTRRGASPVRVRSAIDEAVTEWDAALGMTTPVVIQIVSGIRSAMSSTTRVA